MGIRKYIKKLITHKPDNTGDPDRPIVRRAAFNEDELRAIKSDGMMITVGLDFGTHQTKVCVESKGGVELGYTFMKFEGSDGKMYYTLPSIIGIGKDKRLQYGYLSDDFTGDIERYFKQSVFSSYSPDNSKSQELAMLYSVWYIAFILFDLEDIFGKDFTIQMGAPTDSSHVSTAKQISTRIIASAYKIVEEVFRNDKIRFLETDVDSLIKLTELITYSEKAKEDAGLLVFPEAYACLMPLISQERIAKGMNLMVDIGGGTTDISFFTIENDAQQGKDKTQGKDAPQVYDFFSINMGLNYLTCADKRRIEGKDSNVKNTSEIDPSRKEIFMNEIDKICNNLQDKLTREFRHQTALNIDRLRAALRNRPLVYCGGGSTFSVLRVPHGGFEDMKQISEREWDTRSIPQIKEITSRGLCPILSTAYGLAISTEDDDIKMKPFRDIFEKIRGAEEEHHQANRRSNFGEAYGGFDYANDWDAWK